MLAIEWPDRLTHAFPNAIEVTLAVVGDTTRDIRIGLDRQDGDETPSGH